MEKFNQEIQDYLSRTAKYWGAIKISDTQSAIVFLNNFKPFAYDGRELYADAYYFTSNLVYAKTKQAAVDLNTICPTLNATVYGTGRLPLKKLAVECGLSGHKYQNTLTYNIEYGSYFYIQAILVDGLFSHVQQHNHPECLNCGICRNACPTGCLYGDSRIIREKCLRECMDSGELTDDGIAEKMGTSVMGCFRCQACCPINRKAVAKPPQEFFDAIFKALNFKDVSYFTEVFGKNIATEKRIINLIINACGNSGDRKFCQALEKLKSEPDYCVNAERALRLLNKNK